MLLSKSAPAALVAHEGITLHCQGEYPLSDIRWDANSYLLWTYIYVRVWTVAVSNYGSFL